MWAFPTLLEACVACEPSGLPHTWAKQPVTTRIRGRSAVLSRPTLDVTGWCPGMIIGVARGALCCGRADPGGFGNGRSAFVAG
jgi:hypothetical protein